MAKTKANPCADKYQEENKKRKALLEKTSDEEIGKMIRQRKEATEFLAARNLY